ncbi:MAG: cohesin domain-containing protein [bacterium]|nr:cohesin domain-containing protein [bacterium]
MKTIIFLCAVAAAAAAPCGAVTLTMGSASGAPGDEVGVPVNVSSDLIAGFIFTFEFDDRILEFDRFSLSSAARDNGISELEVEKRYDGRYKVTAEAKTQAAVRNITNLGSIRFVIAPSAPLTTTRIDFVDVTRVRIGSYTANWTTATTSGSGRVTIEAPVPPVPTGTPPRVNLRMGSPREITHGEEPLLRYELLMRDADWEEWPADAYIAVNIPGNRLYFLDRRLRFTTSRRPISREMPIEEMDGGIGFGPLPGDLPYGRYTFFCALTFVGMDPLKRASRITNLADTYFDLVPPPSVPEVP